MYVFFFIFKYVGYPILLDKYSFNRQYMPQNYIDTFTYYKCLFSIVDFLVLPIVLLVTLKSQLN